MMLSVFSGPDSAELFSTSSSGSSEGSSCTMAQSTSSSLSSPEAGTCSESGSVGSSSESINPFEDGNGAPIRKLVLVESILEGGDGMGVEEDRINSCSNAADSAEIPVNVGKEKLGSSFEIPTQRLLDKDQASFGSGGLALDVAELNKLLEVLVPLPGTVAALQKQMGSMQSMLFNMNNQLMTLTSYLPRRPPPMRGNFVTEALKVEDSSQGEQLHTPTPLPMSFGKGQHGLISSPVTSHAQTETVQYFGQGDCGSGYNANYIVPPRSSSFPKSLIRILDCKTEERSSDSSQGSGSMQIDEDNGTSSMIHIKDEPQDLDLSPNSRSKYGGMNLLVLADAAVFKENSEESSVTSVPGSYEWPCSDSGRSTGESYPDGAPPMDQDETDEETRTIMEQDQTTSASDSSQDAFQNRCCESRQTHILPNRPSSETSSCPSPLPVVKEKKTRKRRKTKQPIPCAYCGKPFNNQSSLRQHESFHRPMRPFKCDHEKCEKAYKTRSELNRHLVVHSGEKKHFCKLCGKRFLRKQYLKTHLIRHHETGITMVTPAQKNENGGQVPAPIVTVASSSFVTQAEPLTWRCLLCLKIFVNNEDLLKHRRSYHDKKRSEKNKS